MAINIKDEASLFAAHHQKIGFHFALNGIGWAFKHQVNVKIHAYVIILIVLLGLLTNLRTVEWLFIIGAVFSVLITEMINTSIEQATDAITKNSNPTIGLAKDLAAGAVLLSALYASIVGIIIFLPKIL
ncbi:diacylglycerol kinase [Candidatus Roizmanbacteria bacterium CG10_big_fil_rev_8_21_14_0_10_39_6]|uniref:Diacylglycerol kinase n=1 Tax=Candidatus Roizmanbacteria bacterium CG10_big_fil_rev_8_21_14_0_10_39_6 TaxID=1974853 RepID=A0A2M8KTQ2_9BACT|nr:MAG: diacylglycerol kinase [Candidatus Roizmanbacteria bacterium CG10_big_fil_rev_8_21_14_0_10_39_6]